MAMLAAPLLFGLAFFDFGLVVDLLGFGYPFIKSIEALKTEGQDDDQQWLTYWIIYNVFKLVEGMMDYVISFIPFYHVFKVIEFLDTFRFPNPLLQTKRLD